MGGAGGQYIPTNPPSETVYCPDDQPREGTACVPPTALDSCRYEMTDANPCTDEPDFVLATCEQNLWSLEHVITTCNPPNPALDSGLVDEDAGR